MQQISVIPNWVKLLLIAVAAFGLATMAAYSARLHAGGLEFRAPTLIHKAPIRPEIIDNKVTAPRRASRGGIAAPPPAPGKARRGRRR